MSGIKTEAAALAAVREDGWAMRHVPEALRTEAICMAAVERYGSALCYVPEALRTEAICMAAVGQDGWALYYVPMALWTEAIYIAAVRQNREVLQLVPDELPLSKRNPAMSVFFTMGCPAKFTIPVGTARILSLSLAVMYSKYWI